MAPKRDNPLAAATLALARECLAWPWTCASLRAVDGSFVSLSATERDARRRPVLLPNPTLIHDRSACAGACWPFSPTRRMTMQDNEASVAASLRCGPWNKGKLVGAKPPLRPKHVWSIRTKLQVADRKRDLAMFNLAIDSKLRGCDVVALKVEDIAPHGYAVER